MIIVTGGAGFIGSNLVRGLNRAGFTDVIVVDDLSDGHKFRNLVDCDISAYWDKDSFAIKLKSGTMQRPDAIFHQGASAVTTEWDGRYMLATNYQYSIDVFDYCVGERVPFIYASSAAVYGASTVFNEQDSSAERPLNVYGYSKLLFDQHVRRHLDRVESQVVGLRYFNVYGPGEAHKGNMASVAFHLNAQLERDGRLRLFEASDGYPAGQQRRDFIFVDDVVRANLWLLDNPELSGVFNVGTGQSSSFNDLAKAIIAWHGRGQIEYIPFPEDLRASYQSFTEADIGALRRAGYAEPFADIESGIKAYLDRIHDQ